MKPSSIEVLGRLDQILSSSGLLVGEALLLHRDVGRIAHSFVYVAGDAVCRRATGGLQHEWHAQR